MPAIGLAGLLGLGCPRRALPAASARSTPRAPRARAASPHTVVRARLKSRFGTILVFDQGAYRCFAFNQKEAIQSCVHRRRPLDFRFEYVRMMLATAVLIRPPRRILVLGLGGAALPRLFSKVFPNVRIDAVEIDPAVVAMAKRWMYYRPSSKTRIYVEDAAQFVRREKGRRRYDLVLVDCFGASYIPPHLLTGQFLGSLRSLLTPQGLVVANLWRANAQYHAIVGRYTRLYPQVSILAGTTSGNYILIASGHAPYRDLVDVLSRARQFEKARRPPFSVIRELKRLKRHKP